jgi:hypothetical protein
VSFTVQRYCARNDSNGNPRRVYVIRNGEGDIVATADEGYEGRAAASAVLYDLGAYNEDGVLCGVTDIGDVDVPPGVYRRMVNYKP